jgi:hypothetical protein
MRSERYEYLDLETKQLIRDHCVAHELYAAQQGAEQVQALGVSPLAAMLPTEATKPLPSEDLATAQGMGTLVPQTAMSPTGPASPGQPPGQPGPPPLPRQLAGVRLVVPVPPRRASTRPPNRVAANQPQKGRRHPKWGPR